MARWSKSDGFVVRERYIERTVYRRLLQLKAKELRLKSQCLYSHNSEQVPHGVRSTINPKVKVKIPLC